MLGFMVYCAVTVVGIVAASTVWDWYENISWRKRVTAEDLEALGRLFDSEK